MRYSLWKNGLYLPPNTTWLQIVHFIWTCFVLHIWLNMWFPHSWLWYSPICFMVWLIRLTEKFRWFFPFSLFSLVWWFRDLITWDSPLIIMMTRFKHISERIESFPWEWIFCVASCSTWDVGCWRKSVLIEV